MIQGTSSSAGKSLTVAALCRILKQDGYRVAPFKAQNMALNSFVTREGGEIGRAQAVQAEAAGVEPSVYMNPVLLKPQADATSQVIVLGKAADTVSAVDYYRKNRQLLKIISSSLTSLREQYDVVIIEGAGSPAEINLMDREIVNMRIARLADAPVLILGDIDRGGVFASLVGTMQLLRKNQRKLVRGFIINKFRGDVSLLQSGLDFLEKRYCRPVLGVIPYIRGLKIAQEDSVHLDERVNPIANGRLDIAVIRFPHIANYDDFDPLAENTNLRYISSCAEMGEPDLIILPGTKGTIKDMEFLRHSGLGQLIRLKLKARVPLIGVCGGYQMLGKLISDPDHVESDATEVRGLGLLNFETVFKKSKVTRQVDGKVSVDRGLLTGMKELQVHGYEIHMGRCSAFNEAPAFRIVRTGARNGGLLEGAINGSGLVFGTYLHGIFHNHEFTRRLLENVASIRNKPSSEYTVLNKDAEYDALAHIFRENLNMAKIYGIIFGGDHG